MLKQALTFLIHDRKAFRALTRLKLLSAWCRLISSSGFYFQGKMDIDAKSWWHNREFVAATGGFWVPGDPTQRSVVTVETFDTVRRDMIVLLLRNLIEQRVEGDLAELGVYRGSTARLIHHYLPERKLYLFDTFAGFDERDVQVEKSHTGHAAKRGEFGQTSLDRARQTIAPQNENLQFFPGYFPESAPEFLRERKFAFVNLDADLYEPTLAGLDYFYELMSPGGFMLVHDFNSWPGARKAVKEFFADKPENPIPMPDRCGSALITIARSAPTRPALK